MAESRQGFDVSLITPEKVLFEGEARFVALPAWDGELGILRSRAPIVVKLDAGRVRVVRAGDGGREEFLIDGGFAEMAGNRLSVLTPEARRRDELSAASAEEELAAARALPARDEDAFEARQKALRKARAERRMLAG